MAGTLLHGTTELCIPQLVLSRGIGCASPSRGLQATVMARPCARLCTPVQNGIARIGGKESMQTEHPLILVLV